MGKDQWQYKMEMAGSCGPDDVDKLPDADNYLYRAFLWSWFWCGWQYRSCVGIAYRICYLWRTNNFQHMVVEAFQFWSFRMALENAYLSKMDTDEEEQKNYTRI